ncbi:MAG: M20/M25/M40 family metallo-hydrolase [Lachnospiraceae bacterium]|nr:M20/M25/M40 family metallo-hydrolase [Lachnospiraceae bacterium]
MVNEERIIREFEKLVSFDSESYSEWEIKEYLKQKLQSLGLTVTEDDAGEQLTGKSTGSAGNLYGILPGNKEGEPILFSAHMDTVSPGVGKQAILHEEGMITSDGTTVLGADDIGGLVSILEALTIIQEQAIPHPDIEVIFSVAEELYCKGAGVFDYTRVRSRIAYVLDLVGDIGTAALSAPSILSVEVAVQGKAAHAGFAPEDGINALNIAVQALSEIQVGHVSADTTVNFGTIEGGSGKNIVPEWIHITGEIRSLRHEKALERAEEIKQIFEAKAADAGARVKVHITEELKAYRIDPGEAVVRRYEQALTELKYVYPQYVDTFGGSDNNHLNKNGIHGIVIANAMHEVHTTHEYTRISELVQSAEITLKLMTL